MPKILDLGCGNKKRPNAIGVDNNCSTHPDVVHDLNVFPYPFKDSSFDEIYIDNVLEHLNDVLRVMEEVYRISTPEATIKIIAPYFRSPWAFMDPTHKHFFTVDSFSYFDPGHSICKRYAYTSSRFHVKKIILNESIPGNILKKFVKLIANISPGRYEIYLSHLYPLDDITYYLKVLK